MPLHPSTIKTRLPTLSSLTIFGPGRASEFRRAAMSRHANRTTAWWGVLHSNGERKESKYQFTSTTARWMHLRTNVIKQCAQVHTNATTSTQELKTWVEYTLLLRGSKGSKYKCPDASRKKPGTTLQGTEHREHTASTVDTHTLHDDNDQSQKQGWQGT